MRIRFWVGSIICLFATFAILTSISHAAGCDESECGEGVCASARISDGAELKARGVVRAPNNCWGSWGINVRAGTNSDNDSDYYTGGTRKDLEVSQHTSQAKATSWISGVQPVFCAQDPKKLHISPVDVSLRPVMTYL